MEDIYIFPIYLLLYPYLCVTSLCFPNEHNLHKQQQQKKTLLFSLFFHLQPSSTSKSHLRTSFSSPLVQEPLSCPYREPGTHQEKCLFTWKVTFFFICTYHSLNRLKILCRHEGSPMVLLIPQHSISLLRRKRKWKFFWPAKTFCTSSSCVHAT